MLMIETGQGLNDTIEPSRAEPALPAPAFRAASSPPRAADAMSRAVRRLLARAARRFSGRRPAASPALPSASPPRSGFRPRPLFARATACLFAAAFALLLGAGAAEATHSGGGTGHEHFTDEGFTQPACTQDPTNCRHRPTGYAVPGPDRGQITIHWELATTGPTTPIQDWRVYLSKSSTTDAPSLDTEDTNDSKRSHTFNNLEIGATYTVGVAIATQSPRLISQISIARLTPLALSTVQSVRDTSLTIRFHVNLAAAASLTNGAFTVKVDGSAVSLSGTPSISGQTVTLTLADAVAVGATVTVSYAKPASGTNNRLRSTRGGEVASFTDRPVVNNTRPPRGPGYSIQCSDYGYWYVHGDISGNPGARSGIACDMAKPGWIFEWNRPGYIKWVYRGDRVVTPYTTSSGSIRTRLAPIDGGNARPPVNQPVANGTHFAAFTYIADASNRAVRGADGSYYRERRISGRWQRSISYGSDMEARRKASWNAHYRWRNLPLVEPVGGTFPSGPPPSPPVFQSAEVSGKTLTVTFDANLDTGLVPSPGAFRVTVNNARRNVASGGVAISGKTVTLTLASAVGDGADTVKVRYTKPSANPLQGSAYGRAVATFADQAVTNNTPETIWSATLTVRQSSLATTAGCDNAISGWECSSRLTDDSFTHGGTNYQVESVFNYPGSGGNRYLEFRLNEAISSDWTLHVGNRQFSVADATLSASDRTAAWSNPGLFWSTNNQKVSLRLTTGGISGSGGDAAVGSDPTVVDEGPGPTSVESVTVASGAGADKTYGLGDTIQVEVTFVGPVEVDTTGGTPRLRIDMDPADWGEKWAAYQSGSGTDTLVFAHTVVEPNLSTQGIAVLENTLELNGGTIGFSSGHAAYLGHTGLAHDANHKVDWQTEPGSGAVGTSGAEPASATGVTVVSSAGADKTYGIGDTIHVRVTFDGTVDVTGTPRLKIDMDPAEWGEKLAAYESGSGTSSLTFAHTVVEPNISTQGIAVLANSLELNGGTIRSGSADAALAHTGLAHDANHKVNWQTQPESGGGADAQTADAQPAVEPGGGPVGTSDPPGGASGDGGTSEPPPPPTVTGLEVVSDPGADDTYMMGDTILIRATFSGPVTVSGSPGLKIDMDPAEWGEKRAAYRSGSGTGSLTFAHTVVEPNYSTQGIAVLANSLSGGTILSKDTDANAALGHTGLGHDSGHKVDWRPAVSVADAQANESGQSGWARGGDGASMAFEVSLDRAFATAEHRVTVDYATADGTAKAGEDYTATSGTLTFAAGERTKTVSVPILDDAIDEGQETFKLRLSNARGARIGDGEATGTISNDDPMPKAWLARFGRAAAEHVTDAIGGRLRGGAPTGVVVGGQSLAFDDTSRVGQEPAATGSRLAGAAPAPPVGSTPRSSLDERGGEDAGDSWRELDMPGLLLASSFHLASAGDPGTSARWSLWGRGARSSFEGSEGALTLSGDVTTATVGFDFERERWLVGVALARSAGEGSYEMGGDCGAGCAGDVESALTGLYPYARYRVSENLFVWGALGHGQGDLTLEPEGGGAIETDIEMNMAAAGARGVLLPARRTGGFELALRADVLFVTTASDAAAGIAEAEAGTSRQRLLLEGSRAYRLGDDARLTATLEVGLRNDAGDAETGSGLEAGGSLRYAAGALSVEVGARGLMTHSADEHEEWGLSGSVRYAPGEGGRGLSVRVGSAWGAAAGGAERIWAQRFGGFSPGAFDPEASLDAEAGYGFDAPRGLLTPYTGVALTGSGETWRAGARWKLGPAFDLALEASLTEPADGDDTESGVLLKGSRRW